MRVSYTTVVTLAVIFSLDLRLDAKPVIGCACAIAATPLGERLRQHEDRTAQESDRDLFILATDVQVIGVSDELQAIVRKAISTREGRDTSNNQLQADIKLIPLA
jgi:hypothetical protein